MIDEQYIRDRISVLRTNKGISEYKMSLDLGHSKSYMQSISSGRAMPSWTEFLYICEYLGTTPKPIQMLVTRLRQSAFPL